MRILLTCSIVLRLGLVLVMIADLELAAAEKKKFDEALKKMMDDAAK